MSDQWFYNRKDGYGVQGPHGLDHLVKLLNDGELAPNHEVRYSAIGQWASAGDLKWFYNNKDGSGVHGPVTRIQLQEWLDEESLTEQADIREGWAGDWQPLAVVLGLVAAPSAEVATSATVDANPPGHVDQDINQRTVDEEDGDDFELNLQESGTVDDVAQAVPEAEAEEEIHPDDDAWFCELSGQLQGPLPWSRIHSLASMGRMKRDDRIRHGSQQQLKSADEYVGLFPKPEATPAPPPQAQPVEPKPAPDPPATVPEAAQLETRETTVNAPPPQIAAANPTAPVEDQQRDKLAAWLNDEVVEPEPVVKRVVPEQVGKNKPAPVRKAKKPPKPKTPSRFSGISLGDLFGSHMSELENLLKSRLVVTMVGLICVIALGYGAMFLLSLKGSEDTSSYAVYQEFYEKFKALRAKDASNAEWDELESWSQANINPLLGKLEQSASSDRRVEQNLLHAGRDWIPKMLVNSRKGRSKEEGYFLNSLATARRLASEKLPPIKADPAFQ